MEWSNVWCPFLQPEMEQLIERFLFPPGAWDTSSQTLELLNGAKHLIGVKTLHLPDQGMLRS